MRLANHDNRLTLLVDGGGIDVLDATDGRFGDALSALDSWDEFRTAVADLDGPVEPVDESKLGAPVPLPRQVFAIGLNYKDHAAEAGITTLPDTPLVFTKFPASLTGPDAVVELPSENVDYEAELVVVIGRHSDRVNEEDAWDHVAGFMVGQDLSERVVQRRGPEPQYSMGKSYRGFGPTGPALVTLDELDTPETLRIGCRVGEEVLQDGSTGDLIFSVPFLVSYLSAICPLLPGDLIFTGTPAGVGLSHTPPRLMRDGDVLVTSIEGLGEIRTTFTA